MTQATSRRAYHEEEASGRNRSLRAKVLRAFVQHGPGTSREVLAKARLDGNLNLMRARVTELADRGDIVEASRRACRQSGRTAIVWRVVPTGAPRIRRTPNAPARERDRLIRIVDTMLTRLTRVHPSEAAHLRRLISS